MSYQRQLPVLQLNRRYVWGNPLLFNTAEQHLPPEPIIGISLGEQYKVAQVQDHMKLYGILLEQKMSFFPLPMPVVQALLRHIKSL